MPLAYRRRARRRAASRPPGAGVAGPVVVLAAIAAWLAAGCAGLPAQSNEATIRIGGVEALRSPDAREPGAAGHAAPAVAVGEVRDRRADGEAVGLVAASGVNPFGSGIPFPSSGGMLWFPVPERSNRTLKLHAGPDLGGNLAADAATVLLGAGVTVARAPDRPEQAALRLDLEILDLQATSSDTPTTLLGKGTMTVRFGFSATLVDAVTGEVRWRGWFGRKESEGARTLSRRGYEAALNRVYRKPLADFGEDAAGGGFRMTLEAPHRAP